MKFPEKLVTKRAAVEMQRVTKNNAGPLILALWRNRYELAGQQPRSSVPIPWPAFRAKRDVARSIIEELLSETDLNMMVWDQTELVGAVNLRPDNRGGAEVGCWVDKRHYGQGYGSLALNTISMYAADQYSKVYAQIADHNTASRRMVEKVGFEEAAFVGHTVLYELPFTT